MKNNVIRIDFSNMYTKTDWTNLKKADFLMALYEAQNIQRGDYICLACIKGWEKNNNKYKGNYSQTFIQYSNSVKFKKELERTIKEWEFARYDIYFGSSIFNNEFRRLNEINPKTKFIAVDIDSANYKDFDLLPYLVWESSPNSYQAIYMLEEENRTNTELIKEIKGLQEELNKYKDKKKNVDCGDGARVLRLPGTRNYKPKRILENGGEAPLVGNLKFLNKTVNPQLVNFKNYNKRVPNLSKGIELNNLLIKYHLIDKKDYIEKILIKYEGEVKDRSLLIHQFVGDMIGLGFKLNDIIRLSLWLIENNRFPSLYSKINGRGNDFNKSLSLFLYDEFNIFIEKGRKLGDSLVKMNVANNRKESSMLMANKINMGELKEDKVEFFIDDFLVKKSITILSGDPGIGKTTLGNLIAAIGEGIVGKEYFGDHRLIENFNSWIINFENQQDNHIASAVRGIDNNCTNIRTDFYENYLDFEKQEKNIKEIIRQNNINLLILDPLTALMESITDGKLINSFFQFLRRLRDELGITILCITHNIKTNKDSISLLRTDPLALVGGSAGFGRFAEYLFIAKKYIEEGEEEKEERQNNMTKDELRKLNRPTELTLFKVKGREYNYLHKHYRFSIYHDKKARTTTIDGKSITRTEALEIKDINSRRKEEAKDKTISELADFFVKCEKGEFTSSELKEALGRKPYERFSDKRNGYAKKLIDKGIIEFIKGNRKNKEKNYYKITMPAEEIRYKVCETLF